MSPAAVAAILAVAAAARRCRDRRRLSSLRLSSSMAPCRHAYTRRLVERIIAPWGLWQLAQLVMRRTEAGRARQKQNQKDAHVERSAAVCAASGDRSACRCSTHTAQCQLPYATGMELVAIEAAVEQRVCRDEHVAASRPFYRARWQQPARALCPTAKMCWGAVGSQDRQPGCERTSMSACSLD